MKFREFLESKNIGSREIYAITDGKNPDKIEKLLKEYDWYTFAIDDYTQQKEAEKHNQNILKQLKELGCEKIVNTEFKSMAGQRKKEIDC